MLAHATTQARRHYHSIAGASLGHKLAHALDFSTDVVSRDVRKRNLNPRQAPASPQVKMIEGASLDPDQNLILFDDWIRPLLVSEFVDSSMLMKDNCLH
jgi:hypothetical protein